MKPEKALCRRCAKPVELPEGTADFLCEQCAKERIAGENPPVHHPGYQVKTAEGVVETVAPETHRITKPRPAKENPR